MAVRLYNYLPIKIMYLHSIISKGAITTEVPVYYHYTYQNLTRYNIAGTTVPKQYHERYVYQFIIILFRRGLLRRSWRINQPCDNTILSITGGKQFLCVVHFSSYFVMIIRYNFKFAIFFQLFFIFIDDTLIYGHISGHIFLKTILFSISINY